MIMKKEIIAWLQGERDYYQGVALYLKYGRNPTLKKKFQKKDNNMLRQKLEYKLAQLAGYENVPQKQKPASKAKSKPQPESTSSEVAKDSTRHLTAWRDLPLEVKDLILERDKLMEKRKKLHAGFHEIPQTNHKANKEKRAELLQQLKDLSKDIRAIVQAIRHYDEHKELPQGFIKKGSKEDLERQFNNLKSRKSKYKARVHGTPTKDPLPEGPKKEEAREKLEEIESEMEKIKKLLNE
jgi:hypothetical protein